MTQAQVRSARRKARLRRKKVKPVPTREAFGAKPDKKGRRK